MDIKSIILLIGLAVITDGCFTSEKRLVQNYYLIFLSKMNLHRIN